MDDQNPDQQMLEGTEDTPAAGDRFAVYDETLARYAGGVSRRKPTKADVKRLVGDHDHTIRKV